MTFLSRFEGPSFFAEGGGSFTKFGVDGVDLKLLCLDFFAEFVDCGLQDRVYCCNGDVRIRISRGSQWMGNGLRNLHSMISPLVSREAFPALLSGLPKPPARSPFPSPSMKSIGHSFE